jgi:hypothetical protein
MKHGLDASSSDLDRARELSRRLRPDAVPAPAGGPSPEGRGFVRFRAASAPAATASPARGEAAARGSASPAPTSPAAGTLWDPFLDWCRAVAGAATGFVLDRQGLIVAVRGALSATEAEGIGSRVMVALDQARKIRPDGPAPAVSIDFGGSCLSGFEVSLKDRSPLTIGLIGPRFVDPSARRAIAEAFESRD